MVTFITFVKDELTLKNAIRSLEDNLPDMRERWNVLCLVSSKKWYAETRNRIQETTDSIRYNQGECLTMYTPKANVSTAVMQTLTQNDEALVVLSLGELIPRGAAKKMIITLLDKPYLGFVGFRRKSTKAYTCDNVYSENPKLVETAGENIDTMEPTFMLMRICNMRDVAKFLDKKSNRFGLELRKQGYSNYLIKEVN